jgi:ketosteroid isomerase-like protein
MAEKKNAIYATPEDAEAAFYDALGDADLDTLMSVWAEDEEIVCLHPGGSRLVGHAAVRTAWQQILANGPLRIRAGAVHVNQGMMVAVHNVVEEIVLPGTEGEIAHISATNVYFKGPTGWRLVLHHASAAASNEMEDLAAASGTLH